MKLSKRRLGCERLERREVLSGDVTVSVVAGDLVIRGDSAANYISVWEDGADWIVAGAYRLAIPGSETLVNGQLLAQTFSGVTGGLDIETFAGSDVVHFNHGDVQGETSIDLGDDADFAIVADGTGGLTELNGGNSPIPSRGRTFQGPFSLDGGEDDDNVRNDNDIVIISGATLFRGDVNLTGRTGDDWFYMQQFARIHVEGDLNVNMGPGDDQWDIIALDVDGNLTFDDASSGTPETTQSDTHLRIHNTVVLGNITVTAAAGTTRVELNYTTAQDITVSLGDDGDSCQALQVTAQTLNIDLGAGNDSGEANDPRGVFHRRAMLDTVTATTSIIVETGDGDDTVYATAVTTPGLSVSTGAGSDGVVVFGVNATSASFNTSSEADVIGVYQIAAASLIVQTGGGNEGNGFYGVVVGDCTITGMLQVDSGDGLDNVLLGSVTAASANISTGTSSDGLIVLFCNIDTATFNTADSLDVVGVYDSTFIDLTILLGSGLDDLWYGNLTTASTASLQGEVDGGKLHRIGASQLQGETLSDLTVV